MVFHRDNIHNVNIVIPKIFTKSLHLLLNNLLCLILSYNIIFFPCALCITVGAVLATALRVNAKSFSLYIRRGSACHCPARKRYTLRAGASPAPTSFFHFTLYTLHLKLRQGMPCLYKTIHRCITVGAVLATALRVSATL